MSVPVSADQGKVFDLEFAVGNGVIQPGFSQREVRMEVGLRQVGVGHPAWAANFCSLDSGWLENLGGEVWLTGC